MQAEQSLLPTNMMLGVIIPLHIQTAEALQARSIILSDIAVITTILNLNCIISTVDITTLIQAGSYLRTALMY